MTRREPKNASRIAGLAFRVALGLAMIAAAGGVAYVLFLTKPVPTRIPLDEGVGRSVRIMEARAVEVEREWRGFGVARPLRVADVAADVAGAVIERPARIEAGVRVGRGELIVALDPVDHQQQLARAEDMIRALEAELASLSIEERSITASLELSQRETELVGNELARLRDAQARGAVNPAEIDRLEREHSRVRRDERQWAERLEQIPQRRARNEAQIGVERAGAAIAQHNLTRSRIVAPFEGVLQSVHVREGERVNVGDRVARVLDIRRMEVPLRVPVSAGAFLREEDEAVLRADGPVFAEWVGRIVRISPEADERTRTVTVFIEIEQDPMRRSIESPLLTPGRFVTGVVRTPDHTPRIVVPRLALDGDRVYVEDDTGRVALRSVRVLHTIDRALPDVDPRETQWAVIGSGLREGDRVIVSNLDELEVGMRVAAAEAAASERAP